MTEKQQGDVISGVISNVKDSTAAIGKDIDANEHRRTAHGRGASGARRGIR